MKSMTGYAKVEGLIEGRRCVVELKTVNHRFCDINLRIPKSFAPLEALIKRHLTTTISRGRVDATIQLENGGSGDFRVEVNFPLAEKYYQLLVELKQKLALPEEITLAHVLSSKEVLSVEKVEENFERWDELRPLLDETLAALDTMREAEGAALNEDLRKRLAAIEQLTSEIERQAVALAPAWKERFLQRFRQLEATFEIDETRLLNEVFFLAERGDVNEEIVRLRSHLQQSQELLEAPNSVGRKFDFLLQEMNREVNTIGSKANDSAIAHAVVETKFELEKMREQIQNVE
jgi:uncharacterized protein (TIGR00255 family)